MLYCLQIWSPGAPMRCSVCKSGPGGANALYCLQIWPPGKRQCAVLSANLAPGGVNVMYCLQIWPPGAPMCCIVCQSAFRGRPSGAGVRERGCAGVRVPGGGDGGAGISGKENTK